MAPVIISGRPCWSHICGDGSIRSATKPTIPTAPPLLVRTIVVGAALLARLDSRQAGLRKSLECIQFAWGKSPDLLDFLTMLAELRLPVCLRTAPGAAWRASRIASPYSPECPDGLPLWPGRQHFAARAGGSLRFAAPIADPS